MPIAALEAVTVKGTPTTDRQATSGTSELGRQDFLKLLVTQLQHQDPLNPMDSMEFVTQLTQFSQLEAMYNIDEELQNNKLHLASLDNAQGLNFLGRGVKVRGNSVQLIEGEPAFLHYNLEQDAARVLIHIYDMEGNLVRIIEGNGQESGEQKVEWDGKDNNGASLPSSQYSFKVQAYDSQEAEVGATTYTAGEVTGMTYDDNISYLLLGDRKVAISDVLEVTTREKE